MKAGNAQCLLAYPIFVPIVNSVASLKSDPLEACSVQSESQQYGSNGKVCYAIKQFTVFLITAEIKGIIE